MTDPAQPSRPEAGLVRRDALRTLGLAAVPAFQSPGCGSVAAPPAGEGPRLPGPAYPIERYVPAPVMADILAGRKVDATPWIHAALDIVSREGGYLDFPKATFFCNVVLRPGAIIRGRGSHETIFRAFGNDHVFQGPPRACVRFGWERCGIAGDLAHAGKDCVHLVPAHGFYDTVVMRSMHLTGGGRHGLYVECANTLDRFVQHLMIDDLTVERNARESVVFKGCVIETEIRNSFITDPLDETGASPAFRLAYNPAEGGSHPGKILCLNTAVSNVFAHRRPARDAHGRNNACGIEIEAAFALTLVNHSFEFCAPCIRTADFVFAHGFAWYGGGIGIQDPVDDLIVLRHSTSTVISGIRVTADAANFIRMEGSMLGIRNVVLEGNDYHDAVRTIVDQGDTYWQMISGAGEDHPFSLTDCGRATIIVRRHPGDATGRLDYFRSVNGNAARFSIGQRVTLTAWDGDTIRIGSQGNMRSAGGDDIVMTGRRSVSFAWNPQAKQWWEIA